MTKFKKVLFGFGGLCLLAAVPLVQAQDGPPGSDGRHPGQHIFSQLNLTDDQKKQLEANKLENREKMQIIRQQIRGDRDALKEELMKPGLDMPKIHQIHHQIKSLQDQMEDERLNSILAVRSILTTEQFLKFTKLMHKSMEKHDEAAEHHEQE